MNRLFFILVILTPFLLSCDKEEVSSDVPQTGFNNHILEGYVIQSIEFDGNGNAWVATIGQGLIKYNSEETIVYNSDNSIISETTEINDIAVDSKNNIWIACDGIIKFDGTEFTLFNSSNTPIPEDYVRSIAIDSNDNVWFTSCRFQTGGLVKYDGENWNVYTPSNSDMPVNTVNSIVVDKANNVWLTSSEVVWESYLIKISEGVWEVYASQDFGFSPYYFNNAQLNSKNEICVVIDYILHFETKNPGPQLIVFDEHASETMQFDGYTDVKAMFIDNMDNIWCYGYYGDVAKYDGEKWIPDYLKFDYVSSIVQSPSGQIWIGTGNGIYTN